MFVWLYNECSNLSIKRRRRKTLRLKEGERDENARKIPGISYFFFFTKSWIYTLTFFIKTDNLPLNLFLNLTNLTSQK